MSGPNRSMITELGPPRKRYCEPDVIDVVFDPSYRNATTKKYPGTVTLMLIVSSRKSNSPFPFVSTPASEWGGANCPWLCASATGSMSDPRRANAIASGKDRLASLVVTLKRPNRTLDPSGSGLVHECGSIY